MAAKIGGVGLQIIRDWVVRFNANGPEGLLDGKAPGRTPLLTGAQRAALVRTVEAGPKPYLDGVIRWRLIDPRLRGDKPWPMAVGRIWGVGEPPDARAGIACDGVP
jgi:hypothetical protein